MLIKMITDLRGRMDEDSENFNKELEIILKKTSMPKSKVPLLS